VSKHRTRLTLHQSVLAQDRVIAHITQDGSSILRLEVDIPRNEGLSSITRPIKTRSRFGIVFFFGIRIGFSPAPKSEGQQRHSFFAKLPLRTLLLLLVEGKFRKVFVVFNPRFKSLNENPITDKQEL